MEVASFGRCTVLLSFPLSMYFMARQISGYRPATVRGLSGYHAYTISILSLSQGYRRIGLVPLGGAFGAGVDAG